MKNTSCLEVLLESEPTHTMFMDKKTDINPFALRDLLWPQVQYANMLRGTHTHTHALENRAICANNSAFSSSIIEALIQHQKPFL